MSKSDSRKLMSFPPFPRNHVACSPSRLLRVSIHLPCHLPFFLSLSKKLNPQRIHLIIKSPSFISKIPAGASVQSPLPTRVSFSSSSRDLAHSFPLFSTMPQSYHTISHLAHLSSSLQHTPAFTRNIHSLMDHTGHISSFVIRLLTGCSSLPVILDSFGLSALSLLTPRD